MADFDGVIDPPAGNPDVPQLSIDAVALGGFIGPMNAQAAALVSRQKQAALDLADATDPAKGAAMVGYNEYQTARDRSSEWVSPEEFGAGKPGRSDNEAWDAMLSALHTDPRYMKFSQVRATGVYSFTGPLTVPILRENLSFDGCGSGIIDISNFPTEIQQYLFSIHGPGQTGALTTATANIVEAPGRSSTYPLSVASTSGFSVGDWILVSSLEYFGGITGQSGFSPRGKGFINKVAAIPNSTTLHLQWAPIMDMDATAYTVEVRGARGIANFKITNFAEIRGGVDTILIDAGQTGASLLDAKYVENFEFSNNRVYNVGATLLRSEICINHRLINNDVSVVYQGWNVYGVEGFISQNNKFRGGRRIYNCDCSQSGAVESGSLQKVVHTNNILSLGGSTYNAYTGPGGHLCMTQRVVGHKTKNVSIGINSRGKRLIVSSCDLEAAVGIGAGYDNPNISDPTSYSEVPNMEFLQVDSSTRIHAVNSGILLSSSLDHAQIDAHIKANWPIRSWAKYLNNVTVTGVLEGTDPNASIGVNLEGAIKLHNVKFAGATFKNLYDGAFLNNVQTASDHVEFDKCLFDNVTFRFVRANGNVWNTLTCGVSNSKHTVAPSGDAVSGFYSTSGHTVLYEYNNSWTPFRQLYTVTSGAVSVIDPQPYFTMFVANGTSNVTLSTISGGVRGQQITVLRGGTSGNITINNAGNIYLTGNSCVLSTNRHALTLMCIGSDWIEVGRYVG